MVDVVDLPRSRNATTMVKIMMKQS